MVIAALLGYLIATTSMSTPTPHQPSPHQPTLHRPLGYVCYRAAQPPVLDGRLDDPAWAQAPWTEDFQDIEGDIRPKPRYRTRAKMLWDDQYLYIGAELEDPHVWGTLTEHDSVIFADNDFEVFLDPDCDGCFYTELEMNALNTTWDLLLPRPYRGEGPPLTGWDIRGLRTAVHVNGTLNDPSDVDHGWSVEIAIPWQGLRETTHNPCPPGDGDQWRINFSRVQWQHEVLDGKYRKTPGTKEDNWVWSPQYVVDMHRPEYWGVLQFSDQTSGPVELKELPGWREFQTMTKVWEAMIRYRDTHGGRQAKSMRELGLDYPGVSVQSTDILFEIFDGPYRLDQHLKFRRLEK